MSILNEIKKNINANYFISASAGTGKTYTITNYYVFILEEYEKLNYPEIIDKIVVVTFTRKAASEMKERILETVKRKVVEAKKSKNQKIIKYWENVNNNLTRAIISTIDSFCQRILKEENLNVSIDPNFTIISDAKAAKLIEKSVYLTLKYIFELYDNNKTTVTTNLLAKRKEKIETYLKELLNYKNGLKILFEKMKNLNAMEELLEKTLINWRTEMKKSTISDKLFKVAKDDSEALVAFKLISLISKELYEGFTVDNFEFDFKGVLEKTLEVLEIDHIKEKYKNKFKYIIVDEFQDTNYLQKELFEKLHSENNYVFYVGDRKQSIYRFRGSDVSVFLETLQEFEEKSDEKYKILALRDNYRSNKHLVNFFNFIVKEKLFNKHIAEKTEKHEVFKSIYPNLYEKLWFDKNDISNAKILQGGVVPGINQKTGGRIKYVLIKLKENEDKIKKEAEVAAYLISKLVGKKLCTKNNENHIITYNDFVILRSRIANAEEIYSEVFKKYGIPLYIIGGKNFYKRLEIKTILNALNAIQNPNNNFYFTQFFFSPLVSGTFKDYNKIIQENNGEPLFQTAKHLNFSNNISHALKTLEKYAELKYYISPTEVLRNLIEELNYFEKLTQFQDYKTAILNVRKLLSEASSMDQLATSFSELIKLIQKLSETSEGEATIEDETSNSVKLMSIHASKGLEFKIVILGDLLDTKKDNKSKNGVQFTNTKTKRYYILEKFLEEFRNSENTEILDAIKLFNLNDVYDETELQRKLYVAITRASEIFIPLIFPEIDSYSGKFLKLTESEIEELKNNHTGSLEFIEIENIEIEKTENKSDEILGEIPQKNLRDLRNLAYKSYISPTTIYSFLGKQKELELTEEEEKVYNFDNLFLEETFEGTDIHQKLSTVETLSQLKNLEDSGILKVNISSKLQELFENSTVFSEWRLAKPFKFKGRNYILFGIPDKVFKKNNNFYIVDFKHTKLHDQEKLEKYVFQIQFYMFLLNDFGNVIKGYIVSTKTGEIIDVVPPNDTFKNTIEKLIEEYEKVVT
ncbi:UvrD-helicase domain-containing protein [Thermosipho atlanticus]|uniref:DNA 3'-5' helicase n=1 Tax=Thermosipho atlanticus DSM 15807 TaxID=1123380 RepID=A0A1M5SZX7_9BACT|nr:UvrD-helicase domain-containing protein [Thermosipho atlanticus]SHH44074.1 ATP-dependent exoDNAse (exonuclease V) beta subunit (contains helicase and exonuclease domains) [Thermosipho atlanticus DSM 15807]